MQIHLIDRMTIDAGSVRETSDGYLVANARAARTGVQEYRARELGLTDRDPNAVVRVYRPPAEVFHADALASMAYRPMTNDHPTERVTAANWKDHAIGHSGGEIARDGDFVRVPLVMMDAKAIQDFKAGKRELSVGYTCDLVMDAGVVPAGEKDAGQTFDAFQQTIRANHHAQCWTARGGEQLTFGDGTTKTPQPKETPKVKTILVDGIPVSEVSDAAEAVITRLQRDMATSATALQTAQTALADARKVIETKDGELAAMTSQLADARDPAKLAAAAQARASLIGKAKALLGDAFTGDGKSDADIRRAAVASKIADAADASKMSDAGVEGAFTALTAGVIATDAGDTIRNAVIHVQPADASNPQKLRDDALAARAKAKSGGYLSTQGAA